MTFDPADPQSGQKLEDYFTVEYVKMLNAALRKSLQGSNISGGPGTTVTHAAGGVTIKSVGGVVGLTLPAIQPEGVWVLTTNEGKLEWREAESC